MRVLEKDSILVILNVPLMDLTEKFDIYKVYNLPVTVHNMTTSSNRNHDRNAWISFLPHLLRVLVIEKRILPGIMVVDNFLFCLFTVLCKRGKEPWTGEQIQPQTLKGSVTGNTDLDNYMLSRRVAPDTIDADVNALAPPFKLLDQTHRP
jgi:hypothetical protein